MANCSSGSRDFKAMELGWGNLDQVEGGRWKDGDWVVGVRRAEMGNFVKVNRADEDGGAGVWGPKRNSKFEKRKQTQRTWRSWPTKLGP